MVFERFNQEQERRFRRDLARRHLALDFRFSAVVLASLVVLFIKRPLSTWFKDAALSQTAIVGSLLVSHAMPLLVLSASCGSHWRRWRNVYLPALAICDGVALLSLRWEPLPGAESGQTITLALKVILMGAAQVAVLGLGRPLLFRQQAAVQAALLAAAMCSAWQQCAPLGCRYAEDFRMWSSALRWAMLPSLVVTFGWNSNFWTHTGRLGEQGRESLQDCARDCFVVHGTSMVLLGFVLPLLVAYKREKELREQFLAMEDNEEQAVQERRRRAEQELLLDPGPSSLEKVLLLVVSVSGMCLAVRLMAGDGIVPIMEGAKVYL